ncbi:MAG: flagellar assembly protein FliX, partial [Cohaesibacter sp.]|nr:flagellar assembly protein FliX [Cohaesibacter sp.]
MKIQGPGPTSGPSKTKKKSKTGGDGGGASFGSMIAQETSNAAEPSQAQSIAQMDALLAVQGAEDPTQGPARKRMRKRATDILDGLDQIRMAMLNGRLTVGHMIDIADVVASHREQITDPKLTSIMDEIDLRAQVELAKMRKALDQKQ